MGVYTLYYERHEAKKALLTVFINILESFAHDNTYKKSHNLHLIIRNERNLLSEVSFFFASDLTCIIARNVCVYQSLIDHFRIHYTTV